MAQEQEDIRVRCTKCGDVHMESERVKSEGTSPDKMCATMVCPKCGYGTWEHA